MSTRPRATSWRNSERHSPRPGLADAEDRQLLVAEAAHLLVVLAQQHIDQVADAVALAGAEHRRQRLAGRLGGVPGLDAVDTVVAVAAGLLQVSSK
jgi:Asp/Glu/hydantoin racemase